MSIPVPIKASNTPPKRGSSSAIFLETIRQRNVATPSIKAPCKAGTYHLYIIVYLF